MPRCRWSCWPDAECEECAEYWRSHDRELRNERIESLERQLAAAEEELRQILERREKERGAQTSATLPPEQSQGPAQSSGTDAKQLLDTGNIRPVVVESVQRECQIPVGSAEIAEAEAPEAAVSGTGAESEQQSLPVGMQASPANVQADNEAIHETNRIDATEGAEEVCTDSHEHQDVGGSPGAGTQLHLALMTNTENIPQVQESTTIGSVHVTRDVTATSDEPLKRPSPGASEMEDSGKGDAAAGFLPEQLRLHSEASHCVPHDEAQLQLAKMGNHGPENSQSGGGAALRSREFNCTGGDTCSGPRRERSAETPPQPTVRRHSRNDTGTLVRNRLLQEEAQTAIVRCELSMPCIKRPSAYMSVSTGTKVARLARAASKRLVVKRQRRRGSTRRARSGGAAQAFGLMCKARPFDPGGC